MKGRVLAVAAILLAAACGICIFLAARDDSPPPAESFPVSPAPTAAVSRPQPTASPTPPAEAKAAESQQPIPEPTPYESPVDFETLQKQNPDIIAWLDVPNGNISFPVCFSQQDNAFYLTHNSGGETDDNGALYIEDYNKPDFSDPVTVIYGHDMKSGAMLGTMQETFLDQEFFENAELTLYFPDREEHYAVFAAVPFSKLHILYYYNFYDQQAYKDFFDEVFSVRDLNAMLGEREDATGRVVIISTCLHGDGDKRFLVMGAATK